MAEPSDEIKKIEARIKELEARVKSTNQGLQSMDGDIQIARSALNNFTKAQAEITSAVNKLKSPVLSSIANFVLDNATINKRIALEKKLLDQLKVKQSLSIQDEELINERIKKTKAEIGQLTAEPINTTATPAASVSEDASVLVEILQEVTIIRKVSEGSLKYNPETGRYATPTGSMVSKETARTAGIGLYTKEELGEKLGLSATEVKKTKIAELEQRALVNASEAVVSEADVAKANRERASEIEKLNDRLKEEERDLEKIVKAQKNHETAIITATQQIERLNTQKLAKRLSNASDALLNLEKAVRETQRQFGISAGAAAQLAAAQQFAAVKSLITAGPRVTAEEIGGAREAFQAEFGGLISTAAATELAKQAKTMGVTAEQLAQARRVFMTTSMGDVAKAEAEQAKFIGAFEKQGLTSKDAMRFIGENSNLVARNGSRFAASLARAAADAKKIGVDLGKVDQIGDNIIGNFEGFLEKQAELGAMGFGFDTSRLAEVAETGDTSALFNELRSQLASTGKDITKLRRSEQLALSEAFGISMEDLQRMATGKTEGAGESMEDLQKLSNDTLGKILTALTNGFGKLGVGLSALSGIIQLVSGIRMARAASTIAAATGGGIGAGAAPTVPGTSIPAGGPTPTVPPTGGAAPGGGMSTFFEKLNPTKMLAGAAALLIVSGALFVTAKALQEFNTVQWPSLGKAALALGGLTVAVLAMGTLMSSGVGAVAILAGAAAFVIIASSLYVLGEAIQHIGVGLESFLPQMSVLGEVLTDFPIARLAGFGAAALVAAPGMMALSVAGAAMSAVKGIGNAIGSFFGVGTPATTSPATPTAPSTAGAQQTTGAQAAASAPTAPTSPTINVDLTKLEAKLDAVVRAIGSMKVEMDGNRVGRVLVGTTEAANSVGVFRTA